MSLIVTLVVAGGYTLMTKDDTKSTAATTGDGGPAPSNFSPVPSASGSTTPSSTGTPSRTPSASPTALSFDQKVTAALAALPDGDLSTSEKRSALVKYYTAIGLKFGTDGSPATAATEGCKLLDDGKSAQELIDGVATGAELTAEQSKAFLLGATTLYCPSQAKKFK